jgi:cyanate permease
MAAERAAGDPRHRARLSATETWVWYLIAAVSYIGFGMFHKWLLTWFLGPAWLVGVVVVGPPVWDRLRRR